MTAIQNQQTDLIKFISLNGTEITVGSAKFSQREDYFTNDFETDSGRLKRYYKNSKKSLSISYDYLASSSEKTVDGRVGRDFIFNLAANSPKVLVNYKTDPRGNSNEFYAFIDSYTESIIRRDPANQCIYYTVQFELQEA